MSNEYDDDNTLAGLPTFTSNPSNRSAPSQDTVSSVRPPLWESATMADVREAIEAKARELSTSRYAIVTSVHAPLYPMLEERFYAALAIYHGQPDATAMRFDPMHKAVMDALDELQALDVAEPVISAAAHHEPNASVIDEALKQAVNDVQAATAGADSNEAGESAQTHASATSADDTVTIPRVELEALRRAADAVQAKQPVKPQVSPENIAEAAEAIRYGNKPTPGPVPGADVQGASVVKSTVGEAAAQATQGALSAGASLIGGALRGTVDAVRKGIDAIRPPKDADAIPAPGAVRPMVLPSLSEYRVTQIEDQVNRYSAAQEAFWASGQLPNVRKAIEEKARETGMSVEDVMGKMSPGGELRDLHERYVEAYNNAPDAADHRKTMNKAIDGFVRQYGQAHEEMLAPEQQGADYFEGYKSRVEEAKDRMFKKAGHVPLLDGEDKTNLQRLQEAVAKIIEKVKEMVNGFTNMLRGKAGAEKEAVNEPAP